MNRSLFRLVPPAGAPVPVRAVLPSLVAGEGGPRGLREFRKWLGMPSYLVSSGRAALTILLWAMRTSSGRRREVVVPAYTCFSVASAVARAGLTLRLCDVDPETLDLDFRALAGLDLDRAVCIVPSGLYGIPGDLVRLEALASRAGTRLIDDAAQCMGATQDGRPCGTFGDGGFFSLGRGKGITTMGGGILVTRHQDLIPSIEEQMRALPPVSMSQRAMAVGTSLLYTALLRPSCYWLVDRIPFLGLGGSHFDPDFSITQLSGYQQGLADQVLPLLEAYNKVRRDHADHLRSELQAVPGITIPKPIRGTSPVYLRLPILTRSEAHRSRLLKRLRAAGISASSSYPTPLGDIPGITRYLAAGQQRCPAAGSIARRIVTLPTHPGVTSRDIEQMVAIVRSER
jgi:dTDP-4-amino-4,6-dideoxygalactose transaminase